MKTIKLKYLIGTIILTIITAIIVIFQSRYGIEMLVIYSVLLSLSLVLLFGDRKINTHAVVDDNRKVIATFQNEESAIKFADNQQKNTKIVMLNINNVKK